MPSKDKERIRIYKQAYRKLHREELAAYRKEYRKSVAGRESRSREYAKRTAKDKAKRNSAENREIVAIDGEGKSIGRYYYHCKAGNVVITDKPIVTKNNEWPVADRREYVNGKRYRNGNSVQYYTQDHIYTVLMASTGEYVENANGLSTEKCFNFLLSLSKRDRLIVGYSFQYDVNMMLKDVDSKRLERLHNTGYCRWRDYRIMWIPRKLFSIYSETHNKRVTIWDIFGYFQKRFVDALAEWQVTSKEITESIDKMKMKRGNFSQENDDNIRDYCLSECKECVSLMRKLLDCAISGNIHLTRFDGAGSIASAILKREKVKQYLHIESDSESIGLSAYYGGRFELRTPGLFDKLYTYDINSAYPAALVNAPCLSHSRLIEQSFDVEKSIGLCLVEWDLAPGHPYWRNVRNARGNIWVDKQTEEYPEIALKLGPFPVRNTQITEAARMLSGDFRETQSIIRYPARGKGIYWNTEVAAGMRLYPDKIRILRQWELVRECEHMPFGFIQELFNYRLSLKKKGDLGHLVIKLGINSLYGKTAQSLGGNADKRPPYQNWLIASWTTAHCRSKILDAIRLSDNGVVYIATDGVISTNPIPQLDCGKELGQWENDEITDVFLCRPNLYSYVENGENCVKCGGLTKKETSIDVLREDFIRYGPDASRQVILNRFVGLGTALMRGTLDTAWRKWSTEQRVVRVYQHNRLELSGEPPFSRVETIMHVSNGLQSEAYKPKEKWDDSYENGDIHQKLALDFIDYLEPLADEGQV